MTGVLLALSAAMGFATSTIFARLGLQHMRSTTATLVSMVAGAAVTLAVAAILHPRDLFGFGLLGFLWLVLYALLNFPVGRLLNFTGVRMVGVSRASTIIGTAPLFSMALAVTLGGESINLPIVLGTVAVIAGCGLVLSQR